MTLGDQGYWNAYQDLHRARSVGFSSLNPIGIGEITQWLDLRRITDAETREMYYDVLSQLDYQYRDWLREQEKKKGRKK